MSGLAAYFLVRCQRKR